jgi:hypothetical protein
MSQQEFDNYLALLSRLLRISPHERDRVAEEFRSHLEDRLDELLARGMPRDEAVRQALEEFGDAAGLAAELVSINRHRRNRWIMRLTTASVAAVVLIAAGIVTFWPGHNAGPGAAALVAQAPTKPEPEKKNPDKQADPFAGEGGQRVIPPGDLGITLAHRLNQRTDAEFIETPLNDAIRFIGSKSDLQIIIKHKRLEEAGINADVPITLQLKNVRLSTLLDVMLEDLGLVYTEKDDLVVITTPDDAQATMEVRVYDCRDLLTMPTVNMPKSRPMLPGEPAGIPNGIEPAAGDPHSGLTPPSAPQPGGPARDGASLPRRDPFAPPGGSSDLGGRGFVGLNVDETEPHGLGVLVLGVTYGGPADWAGIRKGDVITAVTDKPCKNLAQLHEILVAATPGEALAFTITPGGGGAALKMTVKVDAIQSGPKSGDPFAVPGRPRTDVLPQAAGLGGVAAPSAPGGAPGGMMGGVGGGLGGMQPHAQRPMSPEEEKAEQLIDIITTAVNPDSWDVMGGPGTIGEYNGLVVVSQSARTHTKIEKVLNMLREAANLPTSGAAKVVR